MPQIIETIRKTLRPILPKALFNRCSQVTSHWMGVKAMGAEGFSTLRNLCQDRCKANGQITPVSIKQLSHPIFVRNGTSDAEELIHTIVRRTYEPFTPPAKSDLKLIIDAGANLGDTAAWFLSRYPAAKVVSLEPDRANFAMLERNVQAYGSRGICMNMGLWDKPANLRVVESESRTALSVIEVPDGEPFDCKAISPFEILSATNETIIDIFKIDIEGAELELFSHPSADDWIRKTRMIMMEIHGADHMNAVKSAIGRHRFTHHTHREIHIFINQDQLSNA